MDHMVKADIRVFVCGNRFSRGSLWAFASTIPTFGTPAIPFLIRQLPLNLKLISMIVLYVLRQSLVSDSSRHQGL